MWSPLALSLLATIGDVRSHGATRVTQGPTIDGLLDDEVWAGAQETGTFTQQFPYDGGAPSEPTSFRVVYDESALYFGIRCVQKGTPVIERLTRRDRYSESDWVWIQLDSFNDRKSAFMFAVNVSGVLADEQIRDQTESSSEWDENWEGKTARLPDGWSAEIRIPLRAVRFDGASAVQSWGMQVVRFIAQKQEADLWAYYPRDIANPVANYGRLNNLQDLRPGGDLELRPFALALGRRLDSTSETSAVGYDTGWSAGLDLRWHAARNLTLDAATFPDFAQAEADQVILNLTNYETFLPEKRPLFLEGTDVFSFPLNVFYSRRVGNAPAAAVLGTERLVTMPAAAKIYGAAKLVGRVRSNWAIGTLNALTGSQEVPVEDSVTTIRSTRLVSPTTAFNVFRLKREWGQSGHVGVIGTAKNGFGAEGVYPALDGGRQLCPSGEGPALGSRCFRDAYVGGLDVLWRSPAGTYVANAAFVQTFVQGATRTQRDGTEIRSGDTSPGGWARVAKEGGHLLGSFTYSGAGSKLDYNDVGYMPRQNLHEVAGSVGYRTLRPGTYTLDTYTGLEYSERRSIGLLDLGRSYGIRSRLKFVNLWSLLVVANFAPARFDDRELGDGSALQRGGYFDLNIDVNTDPSRRVVAGLSGQGQAIQSGAAALNAQARLTAAILPQFDVALLPQVLWTTGEPRYAAQAMQPNGGYLFGTLTALSVGLTIRTSYTFTPRLSLEAYAQVFLAAGHFADLKEVVATRGTRITLGDVDAAPGSSLQGSPADFQDAALNATVVLRWEYILGSTLFIVYSRAQRPAVVAFSPPASLDPWALTRGAAADALLVKLSYWWPS